MGYLEELALKQAALAYARVSGQPEETRLRVRLAREVLGLLEERNPLTDREVFQRDELDKAELLARYTLMHAGEKETPSDCVAVGCPRDGDCPVHGKNRPGQCVPVGGEEEERSQVLGFSPESRQQTGTEADSQQQTAPDPSLKPEARSRKPFPCPALDSAGVPCELDAGHDPPCACPKALSAFLAHSRRREQF